MRTDRSIFSDVKEQLNLKDVAEHYGVEVNRGGFASCLFHEERTPSMKLYDDHFHCFGCGHHGDVTDLTAKLFNLTPIEAARKSAHDFGVITNERLPENSTIKEKMTYYSYASKERDTYRLLVDYCDFLESCLRNFAPKHFEETPHPLFLLAISEQSKFEYYKECFIFGTKDEKIEFMRDFAEVLSTVQHNLNKFTGVRQAEMA